MAGGKVRRRLSVLDAARIVIKKILADDRRKVAPKLEVRGRLRDRGGGGESL